MGAPTPPRRLRAPAALEGGAVTEQSAVARLIARLTGRFHLQRLAAIEEKIGRFGRAHREDLAAQRRELDEVASAVSMRASADAVGDLQRRVEELRRAFTHQDSVFAEAFERARLFDELGNDDRRFARRIGELLRHDRPVIVGPWTGEVGFELLYWIPFVRWVATTYGLSAERLIVVSRGGVSSWYRDFAARYIDVFSLFTPAEFRTATENAKKQGRVGAFDAAVVKRVTAEHGLSRGDLLHPGMMYRLFRPFWRDVVSMARVEKHTAYARIDADDDPVLRELPDEYLAARFYFSDCFPDTAANRAFAASVIETISLHTPVVLLNTPFAVDDHRDLDPVGGRVVTIGEQHMPPERNLAVQTAVIGRARGFVGTYGGYSYLAPLCGVSSLAFYSDRTFRAHHLHVAQRVFEGLGGASLVPLDVAAFPFVRLAASAPFVGTP